MSTQRTQLVKDFAIYGSGEVLLRAPGLITLPIYTRILSTAEYGAWGFMTTAVGLLAAVLILGGDTAYARLYFQMRTQSERQALTSTWFAFLGAMSAAICVVLALFSTTITPWFVGHPSYATALALAILSTPLTMINGLLGEVLRVEFRAVAFTFLNALGALVLIGSTLLFVVGLGEELTGLAAGTDVALLLMVPIRAWFVRRQLRLCFSVRLLREALQFGMPLVPLSIAYWVFAVSDRIVLTKLSTLTQVALYTVASASTALLALAQVAVGRAFLPHAFRLYEEDADAAERLFAPILTYIFVLFGGVCVVLSAFSHEIVRVLAGDRYDGAAVAIGPLALGYLFYISTQVTGLPIQLTKRTGYFVRIAWAAAAVNLVLNIALVPLWGMLASAWATTVAYAFLTFGYVVIGQRLWPVRYDMRRSGVALGATIAFTTIGTALPSSSSGVAIAMKVAVVVAYTASVVAFGTISRRDVLRVRALLPRRRESA